MKQDMPSSGGKHSVSETNEMPTRNSRKNNNMQSGSHDNPSGDAARGYTNGEKIGSMGKDNMKIKHTNSGSY